MKQAISRTSRADGKLSRCVSFMMHGQVIGWLQTAVTDDVLFLTQLFVDTSFRRQGIGSRLMRILIEEAARENKAVTLGVVKTNPARRLYRDRGSASPTKINTSSTCGDTRIGRERPASSSKPLGSASDRWAMMILPTWSR
jgi:ribosomal protein S18 acetylase RimI-like enzyme